MRRTAAALSAVAVVLGTVVCIVVGASPSTAAPTVGEGDVYVPVTPCRAVDTRVVGGLFGPGETRSYRVAGTGLDTQGGAAAGCDVPTSAVAVELTLTAVTPSASGYARVWPVGQAQPTATFLNVARNRPVSNTGTVQTRTGSGPGLSVSSTAVAQYVVDVQGYYVAGATAGTRFVPATPCRIGDTRRAGGPLVGGTSRTWTVTGNVATQGGAAGGCEVPADATAVEVTMSAVAPQRGGYARVGAAGDPTPAASFLNYVGGGAISNTGSVPVSSTGLTFTASGTTDVVMDVQGWFLPEAVDAEGVSTFVPLRPCRLLDTRLTGSTPITTSAPVTIVTAGDPSAQGARSACGVPSGAAAAEVTLTAVSPATGYARLWPSQVAQPGATFLTMQSGVSVSNTGTVALSRPAQAALALSSVGRSDYVLDVQGYWVDAATYDPRITALPDGPDNRYGSDLSSDGRYVVLVDLSANALTQTVSLLDRTTGTVTTVDSVDGTADARISADGTYVAYSLDADTPGSGPVVWLWDRATGTKTRVTPTSGTLGGISADGRYVSYGSEWDDTVSPAIRVRGQADAYRWERTTGTRVKADVNSSTPVHPTVSADGTRMAFDVTAGTQPTRSFLWNVTTGTVGRASSTSLQTYGSEITPDGGFIVLTGYPFNSSPPQALLYDVTTKVTARMTPLDVPCFGGRADTGAAVVTISCYPPSTYDDFGGSGEVYLYSRSSRSLVQATNGDGFSAATAITPDGRFVLVASDATDLTATAPPPGTGQSYLLDLSV